MKCNPREMLRCTEGSEGEGSGAGQLLLGVLSLQRIDIKDGQLSNGHFGIMLENVRASLVQSSHTLPSPANALQLNFPL
jgi:hypothetical protein